MSQKVVSRAALFVNVFESLESGAFFNHFEGVGISCGFRISNCLYVKHSHKRNTLIIKSANIKAKQQTNDETRRKNVASRRKCQRTKPERAPQEQRQQKKKEKRNAIQYIFVWRFILTPAFNVCNSLRWLLSQAKIYNYLGFLES